MFILALATLLCLCSFNVEAVGVGKECKPSLRFGPSCDDGLTCLTPKGLVGAPGICCPVVGLGEYCNTPIAAPPQCAPGFICVMPLEIRPGVSGRCYKLALEGERCGGGVRFPPKCDQGLTCDLSRAKMGGFGTCKKNY